jgi:23S rRNA (pseudouridine1915-N3)-methyltransferase
MNIKLIIGKTDNKALQFDDYTKRFVIKFELDIIPDIKNVKTYLKVNKREKAVNFG